MKNIYSILTILIGIVLVIITFIQTRPCNSEENLETQDCSYLTASNNKKNHYTYKLLFYIYPALGILCIIISILNFYKK